MIKEAEKRISLLIEINSRESLFILQQLLEYNFHLSIIFITRNNRFLSNEKIGESTFKELVETIRFPEKFDYFSGELENAKIEINNLLANDKQAIQKAISLIISNMTEQIVVKSSTALKEDFQEKQINEILNSTRALYKMLQIKELVLAEKKCIVKVTKTNIKIDVKQKFKKMHLEKIEKMIESSGMEIDKKTDYKLWERGLWKLSDYDLCGDIYVNRRH